MRFVLATWALQLVAAAVAVIGTVDAQLAIVAGRRDEMACGTRSGSGAAT